MWLLKKNLELVAVHIYFNFFDAAYGIWKIIIWCNIKSTCQTLVTSFSGIAFRQFDLKIGYIAILLALLVSLTFSPAGCVLDCGTVFTTSYPDPPFTDMCKKFNPPRLNIGVRCETRKFAKKKKKEHAVSLRLWKNLAKKYFSCMTFLKYANYTEKLPNGMQNNNDDSSSIVFTCAVLFIVSLTSSHVDVNWKASAIKTGCIIIAWKLCNSWHKNSIAKKKRRRYSCRCSTLAILYIHTHTRNRPTTKAVIVCKEVKIHGKENFQW